MKISVLIPGYFPVLEYFAVIALSDRTILLDDIKLPRKSYAYRMNVWSGSENEWLSVSLRRGNRSGDLIRDKKIDYEINWKKLHLKRIYHTYRKCIYFDEIYPFFEFILNRNWKYLIDLDQTLIEEISSGLQIPYDIITSSEFNIPIDEPGRYFELIKVAGGNVLLAGMELVDFLDEKAVLQHGLQLEVLDFEHPVYDQLNTEKFIPGLTILDSMFNCGKYYTHFFF